MLLGPAMQDVQGQADDRDIALDRVGVAGLRHPIVVLDRAAEKQRTIGAFRMSVSLPHEQKGTHMSRFLEVLNEHHQSIRSDDIISICHDIKERLNAETAHLELNFPYFIDKKAPVSGHIGKIDLEVTFECTCNHSDDLVMTILVPATSLCPCSKKISEYGAHNQRCHMIASVRIKEGQRMWIEELFDIVEQCASTQVFAVLKRPDEKWVTEAAYDNPKFVEDIVRDLARVMEADDRISWYRVSSENFESIHNHNAYAVVENEKA